MDRERTPEEVQADLARDFVRESWVNTPWLMARYRPPSYAASVDKMVNSMAWQRVEQFGGRFVEFVERARVLRDHGGLCARCGERIVGSWELDHIQPLQYGGDHSYENTQPLHPHCHKEKTAAE